MRKPIPGYEGIYEADQDGSVWRVGAPRNRPLKPVLVYGYHRVVLSKNDIKQPFLVHQLILLTFVGPCPAGQQCRHLNGVRTDNWTSAATWEISTAISDAELPAPTTSTLRPAYAEGSR